MPNEVSGGLQGARNRSEHPFAEESRKLVSSLANGRRYVAYSKPERDDRLGRDFDAVGRLNVTTFEQLGVPREADFYLCGPASFLADFITGLKNWGVEPKRIHTEVFGPGEDAETPLVPSKTTPFNAARANHCNEKG
jgi:ferredoxin-NADP reductase